MRMRRLLFLTLLTSPLFGIAQGSAETNALARELVQILKYERQMDAYREQCMRTAKNVSPESLVKENPAKYGGITPSNRHWPKVVEAYEQYFRELCAKPTVAEFLDAMAHVYAQRMSAVDLKAAIAFYSSDTGKRLIEGHKAAAGAVNELVGKANAAEVPRATLNFDRRLGEISAEAEADKRCPPREMRANSAMDSDTSLAQLRAPDSARHCGR
jgi:hypothetical protein